MRSLDASSALGLDNITAFLQRLYRRVSLSDYENLANRSSHWSDAKGNSSTVGTLREDQPLRLLSNFLFYHFNRSEPFYKFQRIQLLDVIAACNQLNVNALN